VNRISLALCLRLALTYALIAWLAYDLFSTIERVVAYYVPIPVGDYWRVVQNMQNYRSFHLGFLWQQHNEHRIVFPELIFAADVLMGHGRMILTTVVSLLCYAITWAVLSGTVLTDSGISDLDRWTALLLSGVVVFWQVGALVLAQPFLLNWTLMQLALALALFSLARGSLVGVITAGVVATYSSANALLLFPLLFVMALVIGMQRRFLVWLAMCAVVFPSLYYVGYKFLHDAKLGGQSAHPAYYIGFVGAYLSMPFGGMMHPAMAASIGLLSVLAFAGFFVLAKRNGLFGTAPSVVLFGYAAFALLTAAMTAAGRMDAADKDFAAARASRYMTMPLMNWGALLLLALWLSARLKWRIVTVPRITVAVSICLLISMYKLRTWQKDAAEYFQNGQLAALSIDNGLLDSQLIERIFPSPELVALYLPALRRDRMALFSDDRNTWLGQSASRFGDLQAQNIPGEISYTFPVEHGVQVVGWADVSAARGPFRWLLLMDDQKRVVGFGEWLPAGFPSELRTEVTPTQEAWVGFINNGEARSGSSVRAAVVTRKGLVPLHGVAVVPTVEAVSHAETGGAIPNVVWTSDGRAPAAGVRQAPKYGWLPLEPAYQIPPHGSGRMLSSAFDAPVNGCVVVPILHGRFTRGLSAHLLDADSGKLLAELPFRDGDELWSAWRVRIPVETKHLQIAATDDGRDFFQWIAVSAPLACK
jgi:hypothetical protein